MDGFVLCLPRRVDKRCEHKKGHKFNQNVARGSSMLSRCNLYAKAKNQKNKKSSEGKNELTPTKTRRKIFGRNRKYVLLGQPGPIRTHQTVQHVRVLICLKS